ncbi:MAG: hypothetical protein KDE47_21165 [Caldilineaceae bacterium]|nr:hypothetical protein [Caldilineaceae bacterium]
MAKLLPYERIVIETALSPEQVQQELTEVIEPRRNRMTWRGVAHDHKAYEGAFDHNGFTVSRIIHYRNSFLPQLTGKIERTATGSTITITMQPHTFVLVFMLAWFGFVIMFFLMVLLATFNGGLEGNTDRLGFLMPIGMLIFGYLLVTVGFGVEANKSKQFFQERFQQK